MKNTIAFHRVLRFLVIAASTAGALAATPPAAAQDGRQGRWGRMGGNESLARFTAPEFVRRDLTLFVNELDLDEDQGTIVEMLLLDYESSFAEAAEGVRTEFGEIRPQTPADKERQQVRREIMQKVREIRGEIREMRRRAGDGEEIDPGVREELRKRMEPLRERMQSLTPTRVEGPDLDRIREDYADLSRRWRSTRATLRQEFLANLRAVLVEVQVELWPSFERTLRRTKAMRHGRISGESVDLFLLMREIDLGDEEIDGLEKQVLASYAESLDRALVARDKFLETSRTELRAAFADRDFDRASSIMVREAGLRTAVRDANEDYLELAAAALEANDRPEDAEAIRSSFLRRAYARVYRATSTQRSFIVAREMEDLDEDTLVAVLDMEEEFLVDLERRNRRLEQTTRDEQPRQGERRLRARAARMEGEERTPVPDPIRDGFRERTEMDQRYRTRLESLLTAEQIALLPPPGRQERERGAFGEGRDRSDRGFRGGEGREEFRRRMIERFDRDGDGELSQEEREEARESFGGRRGGRRGGADSP